MAKSILASSREDVIACPKCGCTILHEALVSEFRNVPTSSGEATPRTGAHGLVLFCARCGMLTPRMETYHGTGMETLIYGILKGKQ